MPGNRRKNGSVLSLMALKSHKCLEIEEKVTPKRERERKKRKKPRLWGQKAGFDEKTSFFGSWTRL